MVIPENDFVTIDINKRVFSTAVPEPSSLGLLAIGAFALGAIRWRSIGNK
jgi:hypothetical protein